MPEHAASGSDPIDPQVRIGHVHLRVADLERAIGFYQDVLGFAVTQRFGSQAAFLAAGGYHHHIGLNAWESRGGRRRRADPLDSIISRFSIPRGLSWPARSAELNKRIFHLKVQRTTV